MSANILREAAALMRERAEAVDTSPIDVFADNGLWMSWGEQICYTIVEPDAAHIASWHPAVALAVADLLLNEANIFEEWHKRKDDCRSADQGGDCGCSYKDCYEHGKWHNCSHGAPEIGQSLAVARAYLGRDA